MRGLGMRKRSTTSASTTKPAVKWYTLAAEAGDADAQYSLGWCYQYDDGVAIDMHEAVKWYTLAAKAGNVAAQCNLGKCYLHGTGSLTDKLEAVKRFKLAAEGGNESAQAVLNLLLK